MSDQKRIRKPVLGRKRPKKDTLFPPVSNVGQLKESAQQTQHDYDAILGEFTSSSEPAKVLGSEDGRSPLKKRSTSEEFVRSFSGTQQTGE